MSDITEMRKKSLEFRRLSSNLLRSTHEDANVNMARFANYLDNDSYICNLLHSVIDKVEYDFKDCFRLDEPGWNKFVPPFDEKQHLKAQYDLMQYVLSSRNVLGIALGFYWSEKSHDEIVQNFLKMAFKPMIDFLIDAISKEMILLEEEDAKTQLVVQNINTVQGNAIQQTGNGTVNATVNVSDQAPELITLIDRIILELDKIKDASDEVENVIDDLESLKEQVLSDSPKLSRMKKALDGVRKFGNDVLVKLAVSLTSNSILSANWPVLVQQVESFISNAK